jgi:hypothetical protein
MLTLYTVDTFAHFQIGSMKNEQNFIRKRIIRYSNSNQELTIVQPELVPNRECFMS